MQFLWDSDNEIESEAWRADHTPPGVKQRIQDGRIWKSLRGHDGELFFDNSPSRKNVDELRLGITIGFDGCVSVPVEYDDTWPTDIDVLYL